MSEKNLQKKKIQKIKTTPRQNKKQTKIKEKISYCEYKSLIVKVDIVIFLSYFVEKVFLNFMFKRI